LGTIIPRNIPGIQVPSGNYCSWNIPGNKFQFLRALQGTIVPRNIGNVPGTVHVLGIIIPTIPGTFLERSQERSQLQFPNNSWELNSH
jgi:hypothetical protein